jgi:hypothetical protein
MATNFTRLGRRDYHSLSNLAFVEYEKEAQAAADR